jgi:hypothetical protein
MGDGLSANQWGDINASAPTSAAAQYRAILAKHPGDCGAQFGLAMTSLANVATDPDLDAAMQDLDSINQSQNGEVAAISYKAYLNSSPEELPGALYKVSQATNQASPVTVSRMQEIVAKSILPRTDSAIGYLQNVMEYDNFKYEFTVQKGTPDQRLVQLDKGEVGPALAALKAIKALLVVFVSTELDVSQNGNYDWISTLTEIRSRDFDNLSAEQTAALDHAVGLTGTSNMFSTIRPAWQAEYSAIPTLLNSAIDDLQNGLRYGIKEAALDPSVQENDLYTVGTGDADLSITDAQTAIDNLERIHKYLEGNVTIKYNSGTESLVLNIPKFFKIYNGFQDYLPYHKILPYTQWNDTISADTSWTTGFYPFDPEWDDLGMELGNLISVALYKGTSSVSYYNTEYIYNADNGFDDEIFTAIMSNGESVTLAPSLTTCQVTAKNATTTKTVTLKGCRVQAGEVEYVNWIDAVTQVPFVFTDASGKETFGKNIEGELEVIARNDNLASLGSNIIFPDPTFGGVFPGQTNASLWTTIASLDGVHVRRGECKNPNDPAIEYGSSGECWDGYKLPSNPSDLDVLNYYFD